MQSKLHKQAIEILIVFAVLSLLTNLSAQKRHQVRPASDTVTDLHCDSSSSEPSRVFAGTIVEIHGTDCYRQVGKETPIRLDADRNKLSSVLVNDRLRCFGDSWLEIETTGDIKNRGPSFHLAAGDGCFPMPTPAKSRRDGRLLKPPGPSPGPQRGDSSLICWPPDKGAVRSRDLMFRWLPNVVGSVVSLTLFDQPGRDLWHVDNVDGKAGQFSSPEMNRAVAEYFERGGTNPIVLLIEDSKGNPSHIEFSVLTDKSEKRLESLLNDCDLRNKGVLARLCRINTLSESGLNLELEAELEKALEYAPHSEELLSRKQQTLQATRSLCPPH